MQTPYRISARANEGHDAVERSTVAGLRAIGGAFTLAGLGSVFALGVFGEGCVKAAVKVGISVDVILWVVVALIAAFIGARTESRRLRAFAFVSAAASAVGTVVPASRLVAIATIVALPFLAAAGHLVPRWPLITAFALVAGQLVRWGSNAFAPSAFAVVVFALLAYAFFASARALGEQDIEGRIGRLAPDAERLFLDAKDRATFVGPVRLAVDVIAALAIVTFVHSTTTYAYSRSFRLDAAPSSFEATALLVLLVGAVAAAKHATHAPTVAAILAAAAAAFSAITDRSAVGSIALLVGALAIVGVVFVGPRSTAKGAARTTRRFTQAMSATGVFLGSAGFFALVSYGRGEPELARLSKLAAAVAAIAGARAAQKLELHARVELAAEQQET